MTNNILTTNPTRGIENINHLNTEQTKMPAQAEAQVIGGKIHNNTESLYCGSSVTEQAKQLTDTDFSDNTLFLSQKFEGALYHTAEKINADGESPAAKEIQSLKDTRMQWRENTLALNMA